MPIVNINTLQNKVSNSDYMTTYTDVYLKQSLANLGQRLSVKGDGITSGSFTVSDVFNEYLGEFDSSNQLVRVSYNYIEGNMHMYLCSYMPGDENVTVLKNVGSDVPINYIDDVVTLDSDFVLENEQTQINDTDYYKSGATIIKGYDYYITSAVGMKGTSHTDKDSIKEYVCDKLTNDGKLLEGLRLFDAGIDGNKNLMMMHLWVNDDPNPTKSGYVLDIYKPNNSNVDGYNTLKDYVSIIEDAMKSETSRSFITPSYVKNMLAPSNMNSDNFYGWSIVKRYQEFGALLTTSIYTNANSLTYNNDINQYWKISDAFATMDGFNLNDVINYFAYDTTVWLSTIMQKYNDALYLSSSSDDSNLNLKKQIFGEITKKLFDDWISQDSTITENKTIYNIYLPIDFIIHYNCNDNDPSIIYNSIKNLTVKFDADIMSKITKILGPEHEQCIFADTSEDKVGVYGFTITYVDNNVSSGIIDNIEVMCQYVLPYINDDGYWCINDEKTDIFALGSDAGNPNIILVYSNAFTYEVISGVEKQVLSSWDWAPKTVRIEALERNNNIADGFYYDLNAYLPSNDQLNNLPNDQFALVSNALFVNFLSPSTQVYPPRYIESTYIDESKIIYSDFTYDPSNSEFISYRHSYENPSLKTMDYSISGGIPLDATQQSMIFGGSWNVTSASGDGELSRMCPSITYRNDADIEHEGWKFTYNFTYRVGLYQRNWLHNRPFNWNGDAADPLNAGTYINDSGQLCYYYDKVWIDTEFTYSYWWPLKYKADYSLAYKNVAVLNENSLEYQLGDNGVITTFWAIEKNEELNAYEFVYIKKPMGSSFALDTNYINNLDNNIRYYLNNEFEPDNYYHSWVVFDRTNRLLKNNTIDEKTYIYPVIRNRTRDNYISMFGEQLDKDIDNVSKEIYNNDMNFELAFHDDVRRNNMGEITYVGQSTERYYKTTTYNFHRLDVVSDNDPNSATYGMLTFQNNNFAYSGIDGTIKYSLYPYERIPNSKYDPNDNTYSYQFPTFELKEVLLRNVNTINRLNVLSFDHHEDTGNPSSLIYNAYFGTSYETPNKNTLIVGTSYRNINLGTDTMTTYESTYNLTPHNILQLNVDNIELNGYTTASKDFIADKAVWKRIDRYIPNTGETVSIFSTVVQPCDVAYYLGSAIERQEVYGSTRQAIRLDEGIDVIYKDAETFDQIVHDHSQPQGLRVNEGVPTIRVALNNSYAVLSYNNYLLSYLNRPRNTQSRYFHHNQPGMGSDNVNSSYGQTISYLNVTKLLSDYCSIETDCYSYIYGDAQMLWDIYTWNEHEHYEGDGPMPLSLAPDIHGDWHNPDSKDLYDHNASRYAHDHARHTYYLTLTTDLASDENLVFSYSTPRWKYTDVAEDGSKIISYEYDANGSYVYDTYRYVTTNPIAITYANHSYALHMEYPVDRYVYAFTYATSYYMEYRCDGCSLCSSATCKFIEHCKWSEIVGYFNVGTSWVAIDKLTSYNVANIELDREENDKRFTELTSYKYVDENGMEKTIPDYFLSSYMATFTACGERDAVNPSAWVTHDVRRLSYTCWSDDEKDPRFNQYTNPAAFADYDKEMNAYSPQVFFFSDPDAIDEYGQPLIDAHGKPLNVAYMNYGIMHIEDTFDNRYAYACYVKGLDGNYDKYTYWENPYIDKKTEQTGIVYTIANAYYCHIPVTYYDAIRNLKDTYLMINEGSRPEGSDECYLWMNAPKEALVNSGTQENPKYEGIYYATNDRVLEEIGSYANTPNLFVASFTPTFSPVNNATTGRRGWEKVSYTNQYGEPLHGTHYVSYYDLDNNGYIDMHDYDVWKWRCDRPEFPGYSKDELVDIKRIIDANIEETTYTCYFTYLGEFVDTTYAYLSYKCINVRELTSAHSIPYFQNGTLLSTNIPYQPIVDIYTVPTNYDTRDMQYIRNNNPGTINFNIKDEIVEYSGPTE